MGLLEVLFGSDDESDESESTTEHGEGPIRAFDPDGRPVEVDRETYRDTVLPRQIEQTRDRPDRLHGVLQIALREGFAEEALEAARHLHRIDSDAERGATTLAEALAGAGAYDEAEETLESHRDEHGSSAAVSTQLGRIYAARGDFDRARDAIETALADDPNLRTAVDFWAELADRNPEADDGRRERYAQLAERPDTWYARGRLGQLSLERGETDRALEWFEESLEIGADEPGALLLATGPLGSHGLLDEMVELAAPIFDPDVHDERVGINLAQACAETGRTERAAEICDALASSDARRIRKQVERIRDDLA